MDSFGKTLKELMILETYEIDGNRLRVLFPYPYKARPILTILPIIFLFNDEVAAE